MIRLSLIFLALSTALIITGLFSGFGFVYLVALACFLAGAVTAINEIEEDMIDLRRELDDKNEK